MSLLTAKQIKQFVDEDCPLGDITTLAVFGKKTKPAQGMFLAKQDLVLSGLKAVQAVLKQEFPDLKLSMNKKDGAFFQNREIMGILKGPVQELLVAERLVLNLLQRASGIATLTSKFAKLAKPYQVKILDTRKTIPGLRDLEKQAVIDGGGANHRHSLSDQYLIKDNHIAAAGSVSLALQQVLDHKKKHKLKAKIEVEVKNLDELNEALAFHPDIILLDNMTPALIKKAVKMRNNFDRKIQLEISGGVNLQNLKTFLPLGVERISIGALTHSAPAVDISLEIGW